MKAPLWLRWSFPLFGTTIFIAIMAMGGRGLIDDLPLTLVILSAVWLCGSFWILSGIADGVDGWGEVQISDILFVPVLTSVTVFGVVFLFMLWGFAHMH